MRRVIKKIFDYVNLNWNENYNTIMLEFFDYGNKNWN